MNEHGGNPSTGRIGPADIRLPDGPAPAYRTGRHLGRTVYRVRPDGTDELIGMMDTRELGHLVVDALNEYGNPDAVRSEKLAASLPEDATFCPFCGTGLAEYCPRHPLCERIGLHNCGGTWRNHGTHPINAECGAAPEAGP